MIRVGSAMAAGCGLLSAACGLAGEPPYGHPDFYPTPERPVGLQGDGAGHFSGATPVMEWDFRTGRNILWRVALPNWSYSSPIVVGDKVFTTTDWNKLICLDARTGRILWERDNWTFDLVVPDEATRKRLREAWDFTVGEHSKAWACVWEIAYLKWKLDLAKAAREGKAHQWPQEGYGHQEGGGHRPVQDIARDHLTEAETKAVMAKLKGLSDAEVKKLEARLAELEALRAKEDYGPNVNAYTGVLNPYLRGGPSGREKEWGRKSRYKELIEYSLYTDFWNGWMSASFATPVSDGEHIWTLFGQAQVVCYDLAGNRKWIRVCPDSKEVRGPRTAQSFSSSPVLAGDKLIVNFGGNDHNHTTVYAFNKQTGQTLWTVRAGKGGFDGGHPFHQVRRVAHNGIDAIAVGNGMILATADGKIIRDGLVRLVAPPLVHEDKVFFWAGDGECGGGSRCCVQLKKNGAELAAAVLWGAAPPGGRRAAAFEGLKKLLPEDRIIKLGRGEGLEQDKGTSVGCLFWEGRILCGSDLTFSLDAATGTSRKLTVGKTIRGFGPRGHLLRTATCFISPCESQLFLFDLKDPTKLLGQGALGSEWQRTVQLLETPPETILKMVLERHYLPTPAPHLMQTTPFPQGDRLYVRTRDSLYCIGDPAKPYHSPAGAPPQARTQ